MFKTINSGTVVVINNVTITRDLIFGWCVLTDQGWSVLTDLTIEELRFIRKQVLGHPLCPIDFSDAVSVAIAVLFGETKPKTAFTELGPFQKQGIKFYVVDKPEAPKDDFIKPFSQPSPQDRTKDTLELYKLMFKHMTPMLAGTTMIDLGYCRFEIFKNGTILFQKTHREFKDGEGKYVFQNIDNAVEFILKAYW